jgi:hypothetical protein
VNRVTQARETDRPHQFSVVFGERGRGQSYRFWVVEAVAAHRLGDPVADAALE